MAEPPPIDLTATAAHRRGALRLVLGLLGVIAVYLALLIGSVAAPVVLVRLALADPWLWLIAGPALPVFATLVFVLVRGLIRRPSVGATVIELEADQQPRLWEFLERLAAAAGAPMPERVCLGAGVNAAMIRGPTLLAGRRELVIGLGLLNVVDLRELEAVLAHELGHFAQSSARLGQWAHRSSMVLHAIVLGRDHFDERLARARRSSSWSLRTLALVPSMGIRGIRRLLGPLLARLARSNLALAREMEFNADLHAVKLCGSDAIVAALWRAQRGALAMRSTIAALRELGKHGIFSDDLYVHQDARWAEFDERTQASDDPMILALREPYRYGAALHFPAGEAPAEVMAYSHPSYAEREANAKRVYVAAPDTRGPSAWTLLDEPAALRRRATMTVYEQLGFIAALEPGRLRPAAEVEQRIAQELAEREQGGQYFGFYDNRLIEYGDVEALLAAAESADPAALEPSVEQFRAAALEQWMQRWQATEARLEQLRGRLRAGEADPELIEQLGAAEREREAQRAEARAGDRALFCWLWQLADPDARVELERRTRFLAFVQTQIITLNRHRDRVVPLLSRPDAVAELDEALAALHRDLAALLHAAESVALPELQNLETGAATREFLLDAALVEAHLAGEPLHAWLQAFMPQVTAVHDRLRTLHYKNLGRLLSLRERIEAANRP